MKAIAAELHERYQRASELLDDLATAGEIDHNATAMDDIRKRLKAREVPKKGFCWHCRKPLHARSDDVPLLRRDPVRAVTLTRSQLRHFARQSH